MRINYGFVVTSMTLMFVFDSSLTNSVSASSGVEVPSFISTLLRRSLNAASTSGNEDSTQGEATQIRPTRQSGVPQLGLSATMMQRMSAGLVDSIAKFSADMAEGVEFPTQSEMTQAVDQALATSDYRNFAKVAQAIKNSIDALADRKLAESETGESRLSKTSKSLVSNSSFSTSAEQIATAILETMKLFCTQKVQGGRLPSASEVNEALTPALQNIDFSNVKKGAEAVKLGLDHMIPNKNLEGQTRPVTIPTMVVPIGTFQKSEVQA
ncbi:secreted protein [Melampsora americana]|nr:secreted protein [Melampsora americana]